MGFWVETKTPTQHLPLSPKAFTVDWWKWYQTIRRPRFPVHI